MGAGAPATRTAAAAAAGGGARGAVPLSAGSSAAESALATSQARVDLPPAFSGAGSLFARECLEEIDACWRRGAERVLAAMRVG